ncbi:CHAT domain-containing protein [Altererythrobacter lauratis]|uniref:CHAT domain-containing protein n=1 Tax=Alteraurantiacibacter lauratis TaxID=2054627 RepID=A0ABV7EE78_9SPHN
MGQAGGLVGGAVQTRKIVAWGAAFLAFAHPAAATTLQDMLARDRLAAPAGELAAWQDFAARIAADPAADPATRAQTRLGLAIALYYAKDYPSAWEEIGAARALVDSLPESPDFAPELLAYEAVILTELGRLDEAAARADAALALARAQGEAGLTRQALAHNARGSLAFAQSDLVAAEAAFCTARDLGLAAPRPDHAMIVNDASSCGVVKYFLERPDTLGAMRLAEQHALAHLPPDHPKMGNVLNSAYGVLLRYGRYGEAEPLIRRHLELERRLHAEEVDDIYDPLSMLGRALQLRGNHRDAEGIFAAAAAMADRLRNQSQPYTRGQAHINLARSIAAQGRLDEAVEVARGGVARLAEDLEPGDWHLAAGQVQLADHLERLGQRAEALALADAALAALSAALRADHSEVLTARLVRARILAGLGRHAEALDEARAATARFEEQMFDLAARQEERIALSRILPAAFADHLEVALAAGASEDAVRAAQLALLSDLAVPNARIAAASQARDAGLGALVADLEAAQAQMEDLSAALRRAQADGTGEAGDLAVRLSTAQDHAAAAQAALEAAFPGFAALARPRIPSLDDMQRELEQGELLMLPLALPARAVTIAVSRTDVHWADTAITPGAVEALATRLRDAAQSPLHGAFDVDAAQALFEIVFPDALRPALDRADTLIFPASGYLARLSPAVLLAGAADPAHLADAPWLVKSHALRVLAEPGAPRPAQAAAETARGFLGVGAPEMLPGAADRAVLRGGTLELPPLPRAREELAALAAAVSGGAGTAHGSAPALVLAGAEATEERLAALDLSAFGVIAFATHGLVGGDVPGLDEPALLLTATDPARSDADGLLTASEIAAMRLAADWVILSACETAAGESASAPGYSGLARAFAQAGARSLMLSHWRVRDDAAAILSVETLRRAAEGEGRAEALRQAQLALMARADVPDAAHPAVWAPFVILDN